MVRRPGLLGALVALVMVSLPVPLGTAQDGPPGLQIAEILPDADSTLGQREFVEVWNPTATAAEMAGWKLKDPTTTNIFLFPAWSLAPGGRVVVWGGGSADAAGPAWSRSSVWNDGGDAAYLIAPDETLVDYIAYGLGTPTPPPGFEDRPVLQKPAGGNSLALVEDAWSEGPPTPGFAPGALAGGVAAEVENLAPAVAFLAPPLSLQPGDAVVLRFQVTDPNGDADVVGWSLSDGGLLASGAAGGTYETTATAPESGPWSVTLSATDASGLSAESTVDIEVVEGGLRVILPEEGRLRFPALRPGDRGVETLDAFRIENGGAAPVRPRFDISPLSAGSGEIPVVGNLEVGVALDGGNATWMPYVAALLELPELAPGAWLEVSLRILAVPAPLAAGAYGTSFTVVAA